MQHEVLLKTSSGRKSILIDGDFVNSLSVPVGDNSESVQMFVASWITLLSDSPLSPDRKPFHTYTRFLNRIREDGLIRTIIRFTDLAHELVSRQSLMGSPTLIGEWIPEFKDTPVFFEYNRYFKTGDVQLLDYLYTFCNFGKKLPYEDPSFNKTAFRGWLDIETRLGAQQLDPVDLSAVRRILHSQLHPFQWTDLRPKFGPGAVQERGVRGRISKIDNLDYDYTIDRFLLHGHIGMYGCGGDLGVQASKIIPNPQRWHPDKSKSSRIARLRFVPKNVKTARSICMEPNTLMFFQQAVLAEFLKLIDVSGFGRFITIRDQTRNQRLALSGSITSEIDTIDLSAASDSVSLDLVKAVFPQTWLIPMLSTRSHSVILPDGGVRPILKFAPMGSALCFPTQCLIFASVCIYAACLDTYETLHPMGGDFLGWLTDDRIAQVVGKFADDPSPYGSLQYQPLAVYGDDICVDRRLTHRVTSILTRLGFTVNNSKSFTGSQAFRESCGKYYLNGRDITPLYYRINGVREQLSPAHIASQVHAINECFARGYRNLYRFLHRTIMAWGCARYLRNGVSDKNSIPYVTDASQFGILVTSVSDNSHLLMRVSPNTAKQNYQRDEYRSWTISYDEKVGTNDVMSLDAYEYMRWWKSCTREQSDSFSKGSSRYDMVGARVKWIWTPLY